MNGSRMFYARSKVYNLDATVVSAHTCKSRGNKAAHLLSSFGTPSKHTQYSDKMETAMRIFTIKGYLEHGWNTRLATIR